MYIILYKVTVRFHCDLATERLQMAQGYAIFTPCLTNKLKDATLQVRVVSQPFEP